eukprot:5034842-Prymnesium_polylepis.1
MDFHVVILIVSIRLVQLARLWPSVKVVQADVQHLYIQREQFNPGPGLDPSRWDQSTLEWINPGMRTSKARREVPARVTRTAGAVRFEFQIFSNRIQKQKPKPRIQLRGSDQRYRIDRLHRYAVTIFRIADSPGSRDGVGERGMCAGCGVRLRAFPAAGRAGTPSQRGAADSMGSARRSGHRDVNSDARYYSLNLYH